MSRLPDLEAWAVFAKVVEAGSFSSAADELDLSKATVSKAITRLEARLATSLFHRTSRKLALTESGRSALERAQRILAEGEAVESETLAQSTTPQGLVRLACPMSFGLRHIAPLIPEFLRLYPEVTIDLSLSDEKEDLVGEGFDLAVRISALSDSSLLARRLSGMRLLLVGSPDYFDAKGRPDHPRDLVWHQALTYAYALTPETWRFTSPEGEAVAVNVSGPIKVNNSDALLPTLRAGLGLALQPEFIVWEDIQAGRLEAVMCDWLSANIGLYLVSPPGRLRPARVRVLADFLAARLAEAPWAQLSEPGVRPTGAPP